MPEIMRVLQALEVPRERWLLAISYVATLDLGDEENYAAGILQVLTGCLKYLQAEDLVVRYRRNSYPVYNTKGQIIDWTPEEAPRPAPVLPFFTNER